MYISCCVLGDVWESNISMMAQSVANYIRPSRVCGRNINFVNQMMKRRSCFLASRHIDGRLRAVTLSNNGSPTPCSYYSTTPSKSVIDAYHKQGLNAFVYNLSIEERQMLMKALSREQEANKEPDKVPVPSRSELRYGVYVLFSYIILDKFTVWYRFSSFTI